MQHFPRRTNVIDASRPRPVPKKNKRKIKEQKRLTLPQHLKKIHKLPPKQNQKQEKKKRKGD